MVEQGQLLFHSVCTLWCICLLAFEEGVYAVVHPPVKVAHCWLAKNEFDVVLLHAFQSCVPALCFALVQ